MIPCRQTRPMLANKLQQLLLDSIHCTSKRLRVRCGKNDFQAKSRYHRPSFCFCRGKSRIFPANPLRWKSLPVPRSRTNCDTLRTRLERPRQLRTPNLLPRPAKRYIAPIPMRLTRSSAAQYSLRTSAGTPRWSQIWRG